MILSIDLVMEKGVISELKLSHVSFLYMVIAHFEHFLCYGFGFSFAMRIMRNSLLPIQRTITFNRDTRELHSRGKDKYKYMIILMALQETFATLGR